MTLYLAVMFASIALVLMTLCVAVAMLTGNASAMMLGICALIGALLALPTTQFVVMMLEE
ncbi:hypothetical protein [Cypionkella sp.]|jgi:hypothetical protein|uniref:hypothetical protein n=1 Tax=Cypionkella sp. TaxID=2811411 RepID=UPI002744622A|nr:hypothetical protein [Cypionkella sp.]